MPTRDEHLELTALAFRDQRNFYEATDIVAEKDLQVEPIGEFTLVVRKTDRLWFNALEFKESEILSPDRIDPRASARSMR